MEDLRGRNALLTGAGGGLGGYIARALAAEGVNLALSDLPSTLVDDLVEEVRAMGVEAEPVPADLADTAGLEDLVRRAEEGVGPVDILVSNAGVAYVGSFLAQTREELETITSVNLLAVMELIRTVLPGMLERRRGHVVDIASLGGRVPIAYFHSYNATKHGVVGLTHALRAELAGAPVDFSVICPGFISRMGMYGRIEGQVEPRVAPSTLPPERVGEAVVLAIRKNVPETIVTRGRIRPAIALAAVFPGLATRLNLRASIRNGAREMARAEGRL